jgi:GTPase SAR1 family protein
MSNFVSLETEVESLIVDSLAQTADIADLKDFHRLLLQCRQRLKQPMRVAIVGLIKAGKSTLMNALLQEKIVATGAVEATFNVNWLKYGKSPGLKVYFKDGRSPEEKSFAELKALTLRPEEHQEYLFSIKYIRVNYPNPILKTFNIIDTPGLKSFYEEDAQNTQDFLKLHGDQLNDITNQEAAEADAVLYLFSQGLGKGDTETVEAFQGSSARNTTPINAIGVLTKVDIYATDPNIEDPLAAGQRVAARLCQKSEVNSLFYTIYPICGLLAQGVQTMSDRHWQILTQLSQLPEPRFARLSRYVPKFLAEYPGSDIPVSQGDRNEIYQQLGLYGTIQAYQLLASGIDSQEQLVVELLKKTGITELRQLIISHFGHRAFLIKLSKVLQDIAVAYFQHRARLPKDSLVIFESVTSKFDALQAKEHVFQELNILRSYYEGKLDFDESEQRQLLEVTGEYGTICSDRLGLSRQATIEEMLSVAQTRMYYWNQRANDYLGSDRNTIAAAKILTRSYEQILYRVQKAKKYLYFEQKLD